MQHSGSPSNSEKTLTVHVPLAFRKKGGRRLVLTPEESTAVSRRGRVDDSMTKALARAVHWRRVLEDGAYVTIQDLAAAERMNPSYVSRILRLALLAPALVEDILDGRQRATLTLDRLMRPFPWEWGRQLNHFS